MRTIARIFAAAMVASLLISCASVPVAPEIIDTEIDSMGADLPYVESVKEIEEESEADTPELVIHWLTLSPSKQAHPPSATHIRYRYQFAPSGRPLFDNINFSGIIIMAR